MHLNPLSGRWEPDLSHNQRHVNAAIFYNVWHYYQATGDAEFMLDHGVEMMLEIGRFWASLAHYNPERRTLRDPRRDGPRRVPREVPRRGGGRAAQQRLHQRHGGVALPDRPGRCSTCCRRASAEALRARIGLSDEEIATWARMSRRMFVPFHGDGIISQFEGYEQLEDLDWDLYRERYDGQIQRLDRILRAEGEDPNRYKVAKQADTVMLFFLFSEEELRGLFERLGYELCAGHGPQEHRLLRPPHLARLDAELRHARRRAGRAGPRELLGALPGGARERRRRHPGRDHEGGHPHGGHGRHAGPDPARLPRHRDPRRPALLPAAVGRPPRRPVVPHAVPRDADPGQPRRRPARPWRRRAEGTGRPIRVGVGEQVEELRPGERCTFTLAEDAR